MKSISMIRSMVSAGDLQDSTKETRQQFPGLTCCCWPAALTSSSSAACTLDTHNNMVQQTVQHCSTDLVRARERVLNQGASSSSEAMLRWVSSGSPDTIGRGGTARPNWTEPNDTIEANIV